MDSADQLGKKLTIQYSLIQCLVTMGQCTVYAFAAVYLLSRSFTNSQVGLTLTLASTAGLFGQPLMASFADQTRRFALRTIVVFTQLATALFSVILLVVPGIILTASLEILMVTAFSVLVSLSISLSMQHINTGIPINFSLARGIGSVAYALISILLGYLVEFHGPRVIMFANVLICLVGILLVITFPKPQKQNARIDQGENQASGLLEFALSHKHFIGIVGSIALIFFSNIVINTFMIQIISRIGGNSANLGYAMAIAAVLELPGMALFPHVLRKFRNTSMIIIIAGFFFFLKSLITLFAPNMIWFYIAQALQFFSYAMMIPATMFYANEVIEEGNKTKGQVIMAMASGISGLFGNLLGGLMLDSKGGIPLMMSVSTGVTLLGVFVLVLIDRGKQRERSMS